MDLLEIRKKAKEKKEAEEKALLEAGSPEQAAGEHAGKEAPTPKANPRKKAARKKPQPDTGKKPKKNAKPGKPAAEEPEATSADAEARAEPGTAKQPVKSREKAAKKQSGEAGKRPKRKDTTAEEMPPAPAKEMPGAAEPDTSDEAWLHEAAFGEEDAESEADVIEYLAFMLSDEEYAVKVEDVKEIIRLQRITRVPRAEDFVEGIISLRGVIIPVFDIKKRLGLEKTEIQRSTRIVIVSESGSPQGIIVDKVTGVARLYEDSIEPPPAVIGGVEAEYLDGVGRIDDRLLILFNTKKVLEMGGEDIG